MLLFLMSTAEFQTFETTAGEAAAELQRRGINAANPITIMVPGPAELFYSARLSARARVNAAGLSDEEIDALIERARAEIAAEDA
jgi:hypothetical protein